MANKKDDPAQPEKTESTDDKSGALDANAYQKIRTTAIPDFAIPDIAIPE